jgi:hypothetical protein
MGQPVWEHFFVKAENLRPVLWAGAGPGLNESAGVCGGVYQLVPCKATRGTRKRGRQSGGHQERF